MESKRFAIIGGDKRNIYLAKTLKDDGHAVKTYGYLTYEKENIHDCKNLYETIEDADYIIGPIPCANDKINFYAPYSPAHINADDVYRLISPKQVFISGFIKDDMEALLKKYNIKYLDVLKMEEMCILNAIPTAFRKEV